LNQTYIVPGGGGCEWVSVFSADDGDDIPCGSAAGTIYTVTASVTAIQNTFPPAPITYIYVLSVVINVQGIDGGGNFYSVAFEKIYETKPDCMNWYEENVGYARQSSNDEPNFACEGTGATCSVTSI
jgi:hypothetical protein